MPNIPDGIDPRAPGGPYDPGPTLAQQHEAALDRLAAAKAEMDALHDYLGGDNPDEWEVQMAADLADAAERGVAALWDGMRARCNARRRAA